MSVTYVVVLHQIVEGRPSRGKGGLEVFAHLAELGAHIALPHDMPLLVTCQLAGEKDEPSSFHGHHMGIQHVTIHDALRQCVRLDMLAWHACLLS
jgi:hypothetical protein